jgi:hypothetical protein
LENLKGTDHLEDLILGEKITLKGIIRKHGGKIRTGLPWFMMKIGITVL